MEDVFIDRIGTDWKSMIDGFKKEGFEVDTFKDINGNYQEMIDGLGTPYRKLKFKGIAKTFTFVHELNYADNKDKKQLENLIVIHFIKDGIPLCSPVINGKVVIMRKSLKEVIKYI